jgi:putative ubiquitin-RnfH superfamily antitoxin RatB of RatAB toxin-antitoxin module
MVRVEVVYCPSPGVIDLTPLELPDGSTVADAVRASGVLQRHALAPESVDAGIWFRACPPEAPLRERDRVEIYRPLTVDPKEARRLRYRRRTPVSGSPPR